MEKTFPPGRLLTAADRERIVGQALADGTVTRLREATGWEPHELAVLLNVKDGLLRRWESGLARPSPASAIKLWQVLVSLCTTPGRPWPDGSAHRSGVPPEPGRP